MIADVNTSGTGGAPVLILAERRFVIGLHRSMAWRFLAVSAPKAGCKPALRRRLKKAVAAAQNGVASAGEKQGAFPQIHLIWVATREKMGSHIVKTTIDIADDLFERASSGLQERKRPRSGH